MYNLSLSPEFLDALGEYEDYLNEQRPESGYEFAAAVADQLDRIELNPEVYQRRYGENRAAIVPKFKHVIYTN